MERRLSGVVVHRTLSVQGLKREEHELAPFFNACFKRGTQGIPTEIQQDVLQGASVDSVGSVAASSTAAAVVLGAQRAAATEMYLNITVSV